jgi:hypothetical protein
VSLLVCVFQFRNQLVASFEIWYHYIWNVGYSVWLRAEGPGDAGSIPSRGKRIFPPASVPRPALGPSQSPVQWIPGLVSPELKRCRCVNLTTHLHLVPRSWMSRRYTASPPKRLRDVLWNSLSCVIFFFHFFFVTTFMKGSSYWETYSYLESQYISGLLWNHALSRSKKPTTGLCRDSDEPIPHSYTLFLQDRFLAHFPKMKVGLSHQ